MKYQILSVHILLLSLISAAEAQPIKFLEEKTAFCYSEKALTKYLHFASKRNFDGLNNLVLNGKCDFVPDGEIVRVKDYRISSIGKMKVVEFEMNNQNIWTFNALVQTADFSDL
jgi:hypothetical protein